jgi:hypothetical protein
MTNLEKHKDDLLKYVVNYQIKIKLAKLKRGI